jgi:hypothetical protein
VLYRLDRFTPLRLLAQRPEASCSLVDCSYAAYLVVCLDQLPVLGGLTRELADALGRPYEVRFLPAAWPLRVAFFIATWTWILGAFRLIIQQRGHADDFIEALVHAQDGERVRYLQMRGARAPGFMKPEMVSVVIAHRSELARRRFVPILQHGRMFTFPQTFISHLHEQSARMKAWGLFHSRRFIEAENAALEPALRDAILGSIAFQLRRFESDPAIVKRLLRLVAVLLDGADSRQLGRLVGQVSSLCAARLRRDESGAAVQLMLIDFAVRERLKGFAQSFLYHLHEHAPDVQIAGLRALNAMLRGGAAVDGAVIRKMLERRIAPMSRACGESYNGVVYAELLTMRRLLPANGATPPRRPVAAAPADLQPAG